MSRILAVLAVALLWASPADARGPQSHFSFGFAFPFYVGPPAYYPAPPAYYYPPPPVYYVEPRPTYVTPTPAQAPPANCRRFNGDATFDANGQPFYGTACLGADGRWHIVNWP